MKKVGSKAKMGKQSGSKELDLKPKGLELDPVEFLINNGAMTFRRTKKSPNKTIRVSWPIPAFIEVVAKLYTLGNC